MLNKHRKKKEKLCHILTKYTTKKTNYLTRGIRIQIQVNSLSFDFLDYTLTLRIKC